MSYKRLTDKATLKTIRNEMNLDNPYYIRLAELEDKIEQGEFVSKDWHDEQIMHAENEIEEYKSKIENGTLIELPCKVGDKVYCVYHFDDVWDKDLEYDIIPEEVVDIIVKEDDFDIGTACRMIGKFQRVCVCLTKAEAEKKLEELKEKEK